MIETELAKLRGGCSDSNKSNRNYGGDKNQSCHPLLDVSAVDGEMFD
jgi:hypothetical protein